MRLYFLFLYFIARFDLLYPNLCRYMDLASECRGSVLEQYGFPRQAISIFDMIRGIEEPEEKRSKQDAYDSIDSLVLSKLNAPLFRIRFADFAK